MTFHFELGHQPNKKGDYTIFLLVFHKGQKKRIKTSVLIPDKYWDTVKERVKKSFPTSRQDNEELQRLLDKARTAERELNSQDRLTVLRFIEKFQGKEQTYMLLSYAQHIQEILVQGKQWGTFKKYGDTIRKLTEYIHSQGVKDLDFLDVTPAFISGFTSYLQGLHNQRYPDALLSPNTIAKHLKDLRAILNRAVDDGIIQPNDIPRKLTSVREVPPSITGLTSQELTKLMKLPLKENSDRWDARNAWLFAMYQGGVRIADIIQLRWRNIVGDRLIYTMSKNGKLVNVIIVPDAMKILKLYQKDGQRPAHYIFPYLDSDADYAKFLDYEDRRTMPVDVSKKYFETINSKEARIGKVLREIRALAGIAHLTFHTARHTFALRAKEANVDNTVLKNIMQHSNLAITETYVKKLDSSKEDAALKGMYLDKTHHNKEKKRIINQIKKLGLSQEELMELLAGN